MTDNLIVWKLQKIYETLTKTKEEHTLNLRMIKPKDKFNFSEPILNTTKLGLIRLSVYHSMFNVMEGIINFCMKVTLQLLHRVHMNKLK